MTLPQDITTSAQEIIRKLVKVRRITAMENGGGIVEFVDISGFMIVTDWCRVRNYEVVYSAGKFRFARYAHALACYLHFI